MSDREKAIAILARYVFEADDGALHLNDGCDPAEPLVRAIADAIAAGREVGMREAAKIAYEWRVVDANGDEILMVNAGQWVANAIEDAIGEPQTTKGPRQPEG